jgi:hypothetical protein
VGGVPLGWGPEERAAEDRWWGPVGGTVGSRGGYGGGPEERAAEASLDPSASGGAAGQPAARRSRGIDPSHLWVSSGPANSEQRAASNEQRAASSEQRAASTQQTGPSRQHPADSNQREGRPEVEGSSAANAHGAGEARGRADVGHLQVDAARLREGREVARVVLDLLRGAGQHAAAEHESARAEGRRSIVRGVRPGTRRRRWSRGWWTAAHRGSRPA